MSIYKYSDLPYSYRNKIKCTDCINLQKNNKKRDFYGKDVYYCKEKRVYIKLDTLICPSVLIDSKIAKSYGSYRPSGFFVSTAICDIINKNGGSEEFNTSFVESTIIDFFTNHLETNIKCCEMLEEYDEIGPKIALLLYVYPNNYEYCIDIYNRFLNPAAIAVSSGNYNEAMETYINMLYTLTNDLCLEQPKMRNDNSYDLELDEARIIKPLGS